MIFFNFSRINHKHLFFFQIKLGVNTYLLFRDFNLALVDPNASCSFILQN